MAVLDGVTVDGVTYDFKDPNLTTTVEGLSGDITALQNAIGTVPSGKTVEGQIEEKADKVSGATNGNFAALDANGNLVDSAKSSSDFVPTSSFYGDQMPMTSSDSTKVADNISSLKSAINANAEGKVALSLDDYANVYINKKTVGQQIGFANSTASITYKKICQVVQGRKYHIVFLNSETPAAETSRDGVVTDASGIVVQAFQYLSPAGETVTVDFVAEGNGYLYLCVDKNIVSINIYSGLSYETSLQVADAFSEIESLDAKTSEIKEELTVYGENLQFTLELGSISLTGLKLEVEYGIRTKYSQAISDINGRKLQILSPLWGARVCWYTGSYSGFVGIQNYFNQSIIDIAAETTKHGYTTATKYAIAFYKIVNGEIDTTVEITEAELNSFGNNYRFRTINWVDMSLLKDGNAENRIENIEKNVVINLFDKSTVSEGRISISDGAIDYNVASSRISDYIAVDEETKYILFPEYQAANHGMAFYDANKQFISGINESVSGDSRTQPFLFTTPEGTAYVRFGIYAAFLDLGYMYRYSDESLAKASILLQHEGQPVDINPTINIMPIFKIDLSDYGHPQGGAVFGDKLFCMTTELENPFVIDMKTHETTPIEYSEESTNHANNVSFGPSYYDEGDDYPLMYISSASGTTNNTCEIHRIIVSNGSYSMEKISTITLAVDTSKWQGFNAVVDAENGTFLVLTKRYNGSEFIGNAILKYELPADVSSDITLVCEAKDSEHPNGYIEQIMYEKKNIGTRAQDAYQQDAFALNNKLYLAIGYSGTSVINVIDINTGKRLSFVDISSVFTGEVEVCDTYDNGIVVMDEAGRGYFIKKLK